VQKRQPVIVVFQVKRSSHPRGIVVHETKPAFIAAPDYPVGFELQSEIMIDIFDYPEYRLFFSPAEDDFEDRRGLMISIIYKIVDFMAVYRYQLITDGESAAIGRRSSDN